MSDFAGYTIPCVEPISERSFKAAFSGTSSDVSVFKIEIDMTASNFHCGRKGKIII
ncbi:MAG: hypothetical protein WCX48_09320 [Bacteroidales bacterium]